MLRLVASVVFMFALTGASSATGGSPTTPPPEVRPAPLLESAASYVAGKPVHIYCGRDPDQWRVLVGRIYGPNREPGGYALIPTGEAYLEPFGCVELEAKKLGASNARDSRFAVGLLTLIHESVHLRGITAEGVTECTAVRAIPTVARRFFGIQKKATMRALLSNVAHVHNGFPPEYRTVC